MGREGLTKEEALRTLADTNRWTELGGMGFYGVSNTTPKRGVAIRRKYVNNHDEAYLEIYEPPLSDPQSIMVFEGFETDFNRAKIVFGLFDRIIQGKEGEMVNQIDNPRLVKLD